VAPCFLSKPLLDVGNGRNADWGVNLALSQ
jgi:hypothetical protein